MKTRNSVLNLFTCVLFAFFSFMAFGAIFGPGIAIAFVAFGVLAFLGVIPMPKGVAGITTFYTPSDLATGQAKLIARFADSAKKEIDPVTYMAFRRNTEISMPDFKTLRTREDRPLAAYFFNRTVRNLGTGRSFNSTGATGTSNTLVPSYITYNDTFSLSAKLMDDNVFSWSDAYANELENLFKNFSIGNETNATNYLYNNRSAFNAALAGGSFNAVTNVFEIVDSTYGTQAMQITDSMMWENKWQNYPLTIFCDTNSFNRFKYQAQQGGSNYQNLSFQFQGKTYVQSIYLTAKAATLGYSKGLWFAVPDGTIAALDWIPQQNRNGLDKPPYKWYPITNPIDNTEYAGYLWYIGTDTFTNSETQDLQMNFQISLDVAFEYALLNVNAGETPIQAVGLV